MNYKLFYIVAAVFVVSFLLAVVLSAHSVRRRKKQGRSSVWVSAPAALTAAALFAAMYYWPHYPSGAFSGVLTLAFVIAMGAVLGGSGYILKRVLADVWSVIVVRVDGAIRNASIEEATLPVARNDAWIRQRRRSHRQGVIGWTLNLMTHRYDVSIAHMFVDRALAFLFRRS